MIMTDEQARAIVEAGNRLYLRHLLTRTFDHKFAEGFTDDVRMYPTNGEDPCIGSETVRRYNESAFGEGELCMTSCKVLEVFRAGSYLIEWTAYEENDSNRGYFAVMWRFDKGQWRRMRDIFN